ncbi:YqaJ viral recombinase family protein [Marinobacter salarius]|uniref:lambda exonuclease family protein n=1 Tax=Marinobacter salarius TaxID=1420917 RepID=UPI0022B21632|nr:lambda exonuclease family protein [Marinobacter salarius]MCZ4284590.1 YqaJ viral recombinase family protein [Marinobacter salarius]
MIRVITCAQGGPEWHQARCGVITASMFSTVRKLVNGLTDQQAKYVDAILSGKETKEAKQIAGYKAAPSSETVARALKGEKVGEYSDAAKDYAFRLACERISGKPLDEGFSTYQMRRGNELEPEARDLHESRIGMLIERAGFVVTEDGKFGASADGLIDDDGGSEYKCLLAPERIRSILFDGDLSEFMDQVQGCMWLTGRNWWHFCLYCPDLAPANKELIIHRVERDDDYIEEMESDLVEFDRLVEQYRERILEQPAEVWAPSSQTHEDQPEAELNIF